MCIQARLRIISRFKGNKRTKKIAHRRLYTHRFLRKKGSIYTHMLCTKMLLRAKIKAHRRFYTQNLFHRETFAQNSFYTCFFYTKNIWHRETCTHRLHTKFLQTDFFARGNFTQNRIYTAEPFSHRNLYTQKQIRTTIFTDRRFWHAENFLHKILTHNRFYAQHFLHTDAFTHRCLYTDTNCTWNLCTQHSFTQPTFAQRGFASPSWSPTFRVPPLKFLFVANIGLLGIVFVWILQNSNADIVGNFWFSHRMFQN